MAFLKFSSSLIFGFREFCQHFREFVQVFGPAVTCSDLFGCIRMHVDASGCVRMHLDTFVKIQKNRLINQLSVTLESF